MRARYFRRPVAPRAWLALALTLTLVFALGIMLGVSLERTDLVPRLKSLLTSAGVPPVGADGLRSAAVRAYYGQLSDNLAAARRLVSTALDGADSFDEAKKEARQELRYALGMNGSIRAAEIAEITERHLFRRGDIDYAVVTFQTPEGLTGGGYLLRPLRDKRPLPGVIALHGMNSSADKVAGLDVEDDYVHRFGLDLARAGFIVFVPFLVSQEKELRTVSRQGLALGRPLAGLEVEEILLAAKYLRTLPGSNGRVGIHGISLGGFYALLAAALDDGIDAAAISGYFNDRDEKLLRDPRMLAEVGGEVCYVPGIAAAFSDAELAMLVLPRPLLIEMGSGDPWIDVDVARAQFERVAEAYSARGVAGRARFVVFRGGHEIDGDGAAAWLKRWLRD